LSRFGIASTYNFLKEPIFVRSVTSPHILSIMKLFRMYSDWIALNERPA